VRSLRTRILGVASAVLLALVVTSSLGTGTAGAINPPQTTVVGTMNALYNDANYFSRYVVASTGRAYRSPGVGYAYSYYASWANGCSLQEPQMAVYCGGNVYVNVAANQSKINRLGDYASGYWLAHEMGHHVAASLGYRFVSTAGRELYADCMAGVFTRYAYGTGRLNGNDYWEAYNTLGDYYPYEGSPGGYPYKADRKSWYQYGYSNNNVNNCAWYTVNLRF
jgi:predicted metalloprotease